MFYFLILRHITLRLILVKCEYIYSFQSLLYHNLFYKSEISSFNSYAIPRERQLVMHQLIVAWATKILTYLCQFTKLTGSN